ncbi:MAG: hypothetical protein HN855_17095 [Anaerolineae bacterium]|nr:hypothetical protein [Anaerolineae bacterium]MBT7072683.1 hypothetical protein [Anaerolineae bacterium]MBT7326864.1 hypothetical protein [Anaerolineae bacterium]
MMKSVRKFLMLIVVLGLLAGIPAQAQGTASRFFDETKHYVQGAFLRFYENTEDAKILFGYPLTEEFLNSEGVLVQYFQRVRLEMKEDGVVRLSPLGQLTYKSGGVQLKFNNPLACRTYQTNFLVCFTFLEFFEAHGGVTLLGDPISSFEFQDNKIVQYFENGRLEWNPSNPEGQRVVTSDLGLGYFEKIGEDRALLNPVEFLNENIRIVELNVNVFLEKTVADATDEQLIYVVVQDQTSEPLKDVEGYAIVHWTTGEIETLPIRTGDTGVSTLVLPVKDQIYGESVVIKIFVSHKGLEGQTSTSFRIWY